MQGRDESRKFELKTRLDDEAEKLQNVMMKVPKRRNTYVRKIIKNKRKIIDKSASIRLMESCKKTFGNL